MNHGTCHYMLSFMFYTKLYFKVIYSAQFIFLLICQPITRQFLLLEVLILFFLSEGKMALIITLFLWINQQWV